MQRMVWVDSERGYACVGNVECRSEAAGPDELSAFERMGRKRRNLRE
jgi:hypothetical protein